MAKKLKKSKPAKKAKAVSKVVKKIKKPAKAIVKKAVKKVKIARKQKEKAPAKESIKLVSEIVAETAGPDVVPLAQALYSNNNVSEFKLATIIKQEINLTRNMLYRLYDNNLVWFTRKKDKKKGWYIYYWTFNHKRIKDLAKDLKQKRIERLNERLNREQNSQFYICKNKCLRLDFEQSHDFNFKCPECGILLDVTDNQEIIKNIKADIERLKAELEQMN